MSSSRTLPLRFEPLPGEALDSWFEALAHRLHTPLGELLPQLGLPRPGRLKQTQGAPVNRTVMLRPHETKMIASVTRVAPEAIDAMTLAAYHGRAVFIDPATRHVNRKLIWGRGSGSRYCPTCLTETAGRWQLSWRLGWSFACLRHQCLLADSCPGCGRVQRRTPHPRILLVAPGRCPHPGATRDRRQRCGADLREAPVLALPDGHPVLAAQQRIWRIVESGTAAFGVYADHPAPAAQALADLRAVAARALAETSADELAQRLPGDLLAAYRQAHDHEPVAHGPTRADARPGFMTPSHAAVAAAGATAAIEVFNAPNIRQAAERLSWLIIEARKRGATVNPCASGAAEPALSSSVLNLPRSTMISAPATDCATALQARFPPIPIARATASTPSPAESPV